MEGVLEVGGAGREGGRSPCVPFGLVLASGKEGCGAGLRKLAERRPLGPVSFFV